MNRLSSVYVEISTKHIMPQVAELSKFLALPGTETRGIKRQISDSAKQMELDLQSHVKKETDFFKQIVNARMDAIEGVVNQYIPPEIKNMVNLRILALRDNELVEIPQVISIDNFVFK